MTRRAYITKMGTIWQQNTGYTQYPTPIYNEFLKNLRIYFTDRYKNMSIPCYVEFSWPDLTMRTMRTKVLELGKDFEFDADGISIQYAQGSSIWYTGYRKGHMYPYTTVIGDAQINSKGNINKLGPTKRLTQADPISVCTPAFGEIEGKTIFFYNSHTGWDMKTNPPEAMYGVKGIEVENRFDLKMKNPFFSNRHPEHSVTRPWPFKFRGEDFMFLSMRDNYGHRENTVCAYRPLLYSFQLKQYIQVLFPNAGEDFMRAYMTCAIIDNKCWVFYNNAYDSGIQMGVLDFVDSDS